MTLPDARPQVTAVPTIWGNVPQRNKNFTGRVDILARLRQNASSRITAVLPEDPMPQALQGLGGVGKTAIAIEYAYLHRSEYDIVWWIPADQIPQVRASLAALAGRLGLEAASSTGIEGAARAALDALRRGDPYNRWLLIFDNADQPEAIEDLLPHGPGDVLITSRNHRWQSVIDTVSMNVFTRAESKEFLGKRVPQALSEKDAGRLADKLGDLPLALEQAGAMLSETGMPVEEYLRLLDEQVAVVLSEGEQTHYPRSMTAAWKLSVLALEQQLPQARELLRCCAFFGPEPIPRDVFRRTSHDPSDRAGTADSVHARVEGVISEPILLSRAIRELARFALVSLDGRAVSVHRLIQALLRDELDEEERAAYRREVHLILASAATQMDPAEGRHWPQYRELLPHLAADTTELARSRDPAVRAFALDMMRYLYNSGDLASCMALTEHFIKQWTADSGPDDEDVLSAQRNRGNALRQLGRYRESRELTAATLERARAAVGDGDPLTLSLRNSFGADLRAEGDFAGALRLDEETRVLLEAAYGPQGRQTLGLLTSLALDYGLNSNYHRARTLYQQAYQMMDAAPGGIVATEIISASNGLAWSLRLLGSYPEARDFNEDAWEYGKERLGAEHLATLRTANGLSIVSRRIEKERERALGIARESYEMSARVFGDGHPDTLAIAINLANILRTIGETDEALELAQRTVDRYPGVYGPDHPYNYGCLGNLALLRRVSGDAAVARELDERALAGLDRRLDRDHHYSLTVAVNLASDLAALEMAADARALGEGTLRRLRKVLGDDHPATLGCAANLSADLRTLGEEQAADALKADTLKRYAATLGTDHPDAHNLVDDRRIDPDFDPPPI